MPGLNAYEGNSVIMRHAQDERRRDLIDAEAEARDRESIENFPDKPKTDKHRALAGEMFCNLEQKTCVPRPSCHDFHADKYGFCGWMGKRENIV